MAVQAYRFFAILAVVLGFGILPAAAQTILTGDIEGTTVNTFYNSINLSEAQCTECTFTTSPQGGIGSGTTSSSFVAVASAPNPVGASFSTTIRYATFYNGSYYGCQFTIGNSYGPEGNCGTPISSANAFEGVYPSPHCGISVTVDPATCNVTAALSMAP